MVERRKPMVTKTLPFYKTDLVVNRFLDETLLEASTSSNRIQDENTRERRFDRIDGKYYFNPDRDDCSLYKFEDLDEVVNDEYEQFTSAIKKAVEKIWSLLNEPCRKAMENKGFKLLTPFKATKHCLDETYQRHKVPVEMKCNITDNKGRDLCAVEINMDVPTPNQNGPLFPHVGYEVKYVVNAGTEKEFTKEYAKYSGHIFLNKLPASRPEKIRDFISSEGEPGRPYEPYELLLGNFFLWKPFS